MRIGVVTYFSIVNYGAVLQAGALTRFLRSEGHQAEVVDYQSLQSRWHDLKGSLRQIARHRLGWVRSTARRRRRVVSSYVRRLGGLGDTRCITHAGLARAASSYDALIAGSDEIWNLRNFCGWDTAFLLDFGRPVRAHRLSYAATVSSFKPTDEEREAMAVPLRRFSKILVRDEVTARLVRSMNLEADCVLDPVFIGDLPVGEFVHPVPYLAMAGLMTQAQRATAVKVARQYKLKAIGIGYEYPEADVCYPDLDPSVWMGAIKNASCVVSTLFHATAFSLKFNRPFFVFATPGKMEKLRSLLQLARSEKHLIDPGFVPMDDRPEELSPAVQQTVSEQIGLSRDRLRGALASLSSRA